MATVTDYVKMDSAVWLNPTADGVIYGYGVLNTNWLNFTHNHSEGTPQNAVITHWPKEYVEFYRGNPKELKNVGENITKAFDPVMGSIKDLLKDIKAEEDKKKEEAEKKKQEEAAKNGTVSAQSTVHTMDFGLTAIIVASIPVAWEVVKMIINAMGEKGKDDALQNYNADGSMTFIIADYYSGTARVLNHVGWLGLFNNVDKVKQMKQRIDSVRDQSTSAMSILSKRKDWKARIRLKPVNSQKTPAKQPPVKKTPTKQAPTKQAPAKQAPVKQAPVKKAPAKAQAKTPAKGTTKAPATKKPK